MTYVPGYKLCHFSCTCWRLRRQFLAIIVLWGLGQPKNDPKKPILRPPLCPYNGRFSTKITHLKKWLHFAVPTCHSLGINEVKMPIFERTIWKEVLKVEFKSKFKSGHLGKILLFFLIDCFLFAKSTGTSSHLNNASIFEYMITVTQFCELRWRWKISWVNNIWYWNHL